MNMYIPLYLCIHEVIDILAIFHSEEIVLVCHIHNTYIHFPASSSLYKNYIVTAQHFVFESV